MKNRSLLMIPGPVEFDPAVLAAQGIPTTSHVAPAFVDVFGRSLERLRQVFQCREGQPFILAGSGTLAMDSAGSNLVEAGDRVLVVNTGVFGDRFGDLLQRYGAVVTHVRCAVGERPELAEIEKALQGGGYKLVTLTHVDTSTGVMTDVRGIAELAQRWGALAVVDGVCSVAGEELRMDEWGVDLALTASQKAIGVPPGLALLVAGPRALAAFQARKTPVGSYYADWTHWLPVMQAYEARKPAYFATPAVNLVYALDVSLGQILAEGLDARINRHKLISRSCKEAMNALGLLQVPLRAEIAANTMSAVRFPQGVNGADFLARASKAGVIFAGGLHPTIRSEYFRIGHMGAVTMNDILAAVGAVETALTGCGYSFDPGCGLQAVMTGRLKD